MKYIIYTILVVLVSLPIFCQSMDDVVVARNSADRMRDIKAIRINVEKFSDEYRNYGFDEMKINDFVLKKLVDNECYDENADPYLYVNINPIQIDEKRLAASVNISVNRLVYYPAEDKVFISMATMWEIGSLITFPVGSIDYVYDILGKLMDKFILEWYKSQIPYKDEALKDNVSDNQKEQVSDQDAEKTDNSVAPAEEIKPEEAVADTKPEAKEEIKPEKEKEEQKEDLSLQQSK